MDPGSRTTRLWGFRGANPNRLNQSQETSLYGLPFKTDPRLPSTSGFVIAWSHGYAFDVGHCIRSRAASPNLPPLVTVPQVQKHALGIARRFRDVPSVS